MSEYSILPNIMWKVHDVTGYCKKKSSPFKICETNCKLKFVYSMNSDCRATFRLRLKLSGTQLSCMDIKVSTWCVNRRSKYFEKSVTLSSSELNEYMIWEETFSNILTKFNSKHAPFELTEFWKQTFFVVSFTLATMTEADIVQKPIEDYVVLDNSHCITSLCHDFEKLFHSHVMCDVILISGGRNFYAHRNILSARSEVFAAMFRNDMKESKEELVDMSSMEPAILEQFLWYMYSGKLPNLSPENVHQLYAAADKYAVEALIMKCAIFMMENSKTLVSPEAPREPNMNLEYILKDAVTSHFANVQGVLSSEEWKKLAAAEPNFAHEAFRFFVSKRPC